MDESPSASMKQCTGPCGRTLPATSEFFHKDGLFLKCKVCVKAYNDSQKEYRKQRYQERREQEREYRKKNYQERREERIEKSKQYHQENREQILEYRKQYRKDHPDVLREQEKRKREKHKDKIRERKKLWQKTEAYKAYQKRYQQENKEQVTKQRKEYYDSNKEWFREQRHQYRKANSEKMALIDRAHWHRRRAQKKASGGSYTAAQIQDQLKRQKHKCYWCQKKLEKRDRRHIYHIDHIVPLAKGGSNDISNVVLACPDCNLRKGTKLPHQWLDGGRLL